MRKATSFKKVVVCHTNDFKGSVNDKIKGWIEANGGTFEKEFTPRVTHLVVSKKAWKRLHPLVREARRTLTAWIVKYDWLEDSLMSKPVKALPVDKYLYERMRLRQVKPGKKTSTSPRDNVHACVKVPREKRIEIAGVEFDKARQEFQQDMSTAGFHPYSDQTGFVYIITLLRYDILKTRFEKYRLKVGFDPPVLPYEVIPGLYTELYLFPRPEPFSSSPVIEFEIPDQFRSSACIYLAEPWAQCMQLYESDEEPHTYACYTQYSRPGTSKQLLTLAPPGSTWDFTWTMFQKFFKQRVGLMWEERAKAGSEIEVEAENENGIFQYQAPRLGEPEGLREAPAHDHESVIQYVEGAMEELTPVKDMDVIEEYENCTDEPNQESDEACDEAAEPDDAHLP